MPAKVYQPRTEATVSEDNFSCEAESCVIWVCRLLFGMSCMERVLRVVRIFGWGTKNLFVCWMCCVNVGRATCVYSIAMSLV